MRIDKILLSALLACAATTAHAAGPMKEIKIYNNSSATIYPVLEIGKTGVDAWLQGQFDVTDIKTFSYSRDKINRVYLAEDKGVAPGKSLIIRLPFYSELVAKPNGAKPDQYVDWWNGGRIYFYDDAAQLKANYALDSKSPVAPLTTGPCSFTTSCKHLKIFGVDRGLPLSDRTQLIEYTFADAITANGPPYPIHVNKVGYNISSVDQVYLPVAMEPLGNPLVPYIGTVETLETFRARLKKFLTKFPGWPVYSPASQDQPRVPSAYNLFANASNGVLTPAGASVEAMRNLYRQCTSANPPKTTQCTQYQKVVALFKKNYADFTKLACRDPKEKDTETEMLKKIYGWVPFNEGCGPTTNDLKDTVGVAKFTQLQKIYIESLQYAKAAPLFNPYVQLIHSSGYLDMAAYAFSVDDAIGFQSHVGEGLILAIGGDDGLENKNQLDLKKQVNVNLGVHKLGTREWAKYGLCSQTADTGGVDPNHPSFKFYPQTYPCWFTATAVSGKTYQFRIDAGPPNLTTSCPSGAKSPAWCAGVQVVDPNNINTTVPN